MIDFHEIIEFQKIIFELLEPSISVSLDYIYIIYYHFAEHVWKIFPKKKYAQLFSKISLFLRKSSFCPNFLFLRQFYGQHFNFWATSGFFDIVLFLDKIYVFRQNLIFLKKKSNFCTGF